EDQPMRVAIKICVLAALLILAGCHDGLHYGHGDGYYAHAGQRHVKGGGGHGRHGDGYRRGHPQHGRHGHGRHR
ncbi:MAG: hypothetical protein ACYTAU_09500, partial [Planctomycetota bacterium]